MTRSAFWRGCTTSVDAGLDLTPKGAFDLANKKASRKLLAKAEGIVKKKYKPISREEMYERIDWLIRTGSPTDVGKAIELRVKLETADEDKAKAEADGPADPVKTCSQFSDALLAAFVLAHHNILAPPDWLNQSFSGASTPATSPRWPQFAAPRRG
jgi:hypothetical protein